MVIELSVGAPSAFWAVNKRGDTVSALNTAVYNLRELLVSVRRYFLRESRDNNRVIDSGDEQQGRPVAINARQAALLLNPVNMHHFSSSCGVARLLMSGYLRYPPGNLSLGLFEELCCTSVRLEAGERSVLSGAFDKRILMHKYSGIIFFLCEDIWRKGKPVCHLDSPTYASTWYAISDLHKHIDIVSHRCCYCHYRICSCTRKTCNPLSHYRLNNQRAFLLFLSFGRAESSMVWSRRWWALVGTVTAACRLFFLFSFSAEAPLSLSLECKWETVTSSSHANWKNKTYSNIVTHYKFCILPSFCSS